MMIKGGNRILMFPFKYKVALSYYFNHFKGSLPSPIGINLIGISLCMFYH